MRTRLLWMLSVALLFAAPPSVSAFNLPKLLGGPGNDQQNLDTFKLIHVKDLAAMMQDKKNDLHIYDANVAETREKFGVIPGAHLLSSSDSDNIAGTLPADKSAQLIFYCANDH